MHHETGPTLTVALLRSVRCRTRSSQRTRGCFALTPLASTVTVGHSMRSSGAALARALPGAALLVVLAYAHPGAFSNRFTDALQPPPRSAAMTAAGDRQVWAGIGAYRMSPEQTIANMATAPPTTCRSSGATPLQTSLRMPRHADSCTGAPIRSCCRDYS